jgi:hypothetical protein
LRPGIALRANIALSALRTLRTCITLRTLRSLRPGVALRAGIALGSLRTLSTRIALWALSTLSTRIALWALRTFGTLRASSALRTLRALRALRRDCEYNLKVVGKAGRAVTTAVKKRDGVFDVAGLIRRRRADLPLLIIVRICRILNYQNIADTEQGEEDVNVKIIERQMRNIDLCRRCLCGVVVDDVARTGIA